MPWPALNVLSRAASTRSRRGTDCRPALPQFQIPVLTPAQPLHTAPPRPPCAMRNAASAARPGRRAMGNAAAAAAAALGAAISAAGLVNLRDPQWGGGGAAAAAAQGAPPPPHGGGGRELLLLAATGGLLTGAALTYRHVHHAGAGNRRLPGTLTFTLCASAGALEFLVFVLPAGDGGGADPGEQAGRALGLAALRALPAAAAVTFYLGMLLIVVGHIRAGGEGGGGVVAGHEPIPAPVGLTILTKMALGAAAALLALDFDKESEQIQFKKEMRRHCTAPKFPLQPVDPPAGSKASGSTLVGVGSPSLWSRWGSGSGSSSSRHVRRDATKASSDPRDVPIQIRRRELEHNPTPPH
ncbi:hypothetical protein U9M48_029398 [Paspalum notatum var. saurae]|uniref:Uncharacterized protein n=1 Tax=Paspalum notatum var. saurae TaxID=547442 RepID=A0AAQ3TYJ2_PASNO